MSCSLLMVSYSFWFPFASCSSSGFPFQFLLIPAKCPLIALDSFSLSFWFLSVCFASFSYLFVYLKALSLFYQIGAGGTWAGPEALPSTRGPPGTADPARACSIGGTWNLVGHQGEQMHFCRNLSKYVAGCEIVFKARGARYAARVALHY